MLKKTLLVSGIALAVAGPAMAEQRTSSVRDNGFSYTYGQLAYDQWDYDDSLDVDALTAEGAFALDEHLFLRGGLSFYDGDFDYSYYDDSDVDGNRLYAGVGFHTPLVRKLDFVGSADIIYDEYETDVVVCVPFGGCASSDADDDDVGFELRGGVRFAATDMLELEGGLSYYDVFDDDISLYGQGLLKVAPAFDVGGRVMLGGDRETIGVFGRYNF